MAATRETQSEQSYSRDFWAFIEANAGANPSALRLKYYGKDMGFDVDFAILQVECRQKYAKKFADTLRRIPRFIFPSALAAEQATSDALAAYHASLVEPGASVADLTAGLGIDCLHLAEVATEVMAVERADDRAQALRDNYQDISNIRIVEADCREVAAEAGADSCDVVFVDPARRKADGSRVYALADCEPDVAQMQGDIMKMATTLIVKASPMLDITRMALELPGTRRMIALGNATECKELVAVAGRDPEASYSISAITLLPSGSIDEFVFTHEEERQAQATYRRPEEGDYLYVPYPSVMKAGPFTLLSARYGVDKLAPNTHLYVGGNPCVEDFPGERLYIERIYTYESKHIKRLKADYPALMVATRNFDIAAADLRKKLGVKDGGTKRLFAVTLADGGKVMMIAAPI